jgi:hypothetical protein
LFFFTEDSTCYHDKLELNTAPHIREVTPQVTSATQHTQRFNHPNIFGQYLLTEDGLRTDGTNE